ncbi:MAG: hypothetical protein SAK29_17185 [Scytonema sp. PMC 1069.18]|nr:hypothetical protein [Scytonema sp. PMC 1069.18]MEC4883729.1 hypothetical protein [Scytonema sp. PMC 1070.18]
MNPLKFLKDSFIYSVPIYGFLLLLNIPGFLVTPFLILNLPTTGWGLLFFALAVLGNAFLTIWTWGASTYYIYSYFFQPKVSIVRALKNTFTKIEELILGSLMVFGVCLIGLILFIIPGLYLWIKYYFLAEAILIENRTAKDGMKRSWDLVRGRWTSVFLAILVNILVFNYLANDLSSQIIVRLFPTIEDRAEMIGTILGFLVNPFNQVYNVLLFVRVRQLSSP